MSKKSKKKRRRRESSSEEEERESKKDEHRKSVTRRTDVKSQDRNSYAARNYKEASSPTKDVSHGSRQMKKPVYRLATKHETKQKPADKEEKSTKVIRASVPVHGAHCSSKAKDHSSSKDTVSGSKDKERRRTGGLNKDADTVPRRRPETSKCSLDEKVSQGSKSKLIKELMTSSSETSKQKEEARQELKRKHRAEEPPKTGTESSSVKTREASKASPTDSIVQRKEELFDEMCNRTRPKITFKIEKGTKTPSVSTTKQSSSSAKLTASPSSSALGKKVSSVSGNNSVLNQTTKSLSALISSLSSPQPPTFKIPKKVQLKPAESPLERKDRNRNVIHQTGPAESRPSGSNSEQKTVQQAHSFLDVAPNVSPPGQNKVSSLSVKLPATVDTTTELRNDQAQVVEELHLARSEGRLEVNVMQSYGELTCMDIDPPEEGAPDTHTKQPPQQDLILVLDTNILLAHLDFVKKIISHGLGALGFPVVLIPWVVLQELDSLKRGRGLTGSVAHLAVPAISYIYNSLKNQEPRIWGQSMQQATDSSHGLNAENNDDRVLQCCLQYQSLYPGCALILCTNDKNLCSKALLSGVKALSKNDLETEVGRPGHGFNPMQDIKTSTLCPTGPQVPVPVLDSSLLPVQQCSGERTGPTERDQEWLRKTGADEKTKWDQSCVSELDDCLREVLSDVVEAEMKAAYDHLWLEIVYPKPPWALQDVLQCLKKHWVAVFGHIVPRWLLQTVSNLINFFTSGKSVDCSTTLAAAQEAKNLVKEFGKSSSRVPSAISAINNIINKLQPQQGDCSACDVVMNEAEDKQSTSARVSHQEVWALFENIWSNVFQISLEVFKALGFDPHTKLSTLSAGSPPPPQDALVYLHKLSSMVSQLLQAFSSVLSSAPGLEEVQALLTVILSNKIVDVDPRLTAKDLLDCFSQQDYREKLSIGGNQLLELKAALDCCVGTTAQHVNFTSQL